MDERDVRVAGSLAFRFATGHVGCEVDDLRQVALLALDKASGDFDAARGVPFSAFAAQRMKRAIIDELRRVGPWIRGGNPRSQAAIVEDFDGFLDRHDPDDPSDDDRGAGLDVAGLDVERLLMTGREWRIITALAADQTLEEVAAREGISPARVSQIRGVVRERLRPSDAPDAPADVVTVLPQTSSAMPEWPRAREERGSGLTHRELAVLHAAADDLTNDQTAELFGIGKQTVMTYRKGILKKLGARSMTGAVAVAFRQGLIS